MLVYLDTDFRCHVENDGTMTAYETDFFAGKCTEFIEGYRIIPEGETWIRDDGVIFRGLMICSWVDYRELEAAQIAYEREQYPLLITENADMKAALEVMEVSL